PVGEPSGPPVLAGDFPGGSARDQRGASRPAGGGRLVLHAAGPVSRPAGGGEDGRRPAGRGGSGACAPSGGPRTGGASAGRAPGAEPKDATGQASAWSLGAEKVTSHAQTYPSGAAGSVVSGIASSGSSATCASSSTAAASEGPSSLSVRVPVPPGPNVGEHPA